MEATGSDHQQEPTLQSPAEGVAAMLTRPPSVSLEPSKRKHQINLAPRATRPHKSPSSSSVLAGVKQEFAHRLWRTLGDVLQEVNIDNFTFSGKPMTRGQSLSPTAGPSTPAFPPQQYVDTRPLAYVHLLQQENHQLLAPPQPTQTPPLIPCPTSGRLCIHSYNSSTTPSTSQLSIRCSVMLPLEPHLSKHLTWPATVSMQHTWHLQHSRPVWVPLL